MCQDSSGPVTRLPNIVLVLADDMGYGDVGVYNAASRIPTPRMDRLAAEGIRFTDAHSADSVCTPSRYGVLTGRYCWRTQLQRTVLFNYEPPLIEQDRLTVPSLLRRSGYRTGMFGKWHLGLNFAVKPDRQVKFERPLPWYSGPRPDPEVGRSIDFSKPIAGGPTDLGFDEAFYTAGCSTDQEPFCFIRNGAFVGMENAEYRHPSGSWRSGMTAENWVNETVDVSFTHEATEFIRRMGADSARRPFFTFLALSAPHSPHLVPEFAAGRSAAGVRGDMVWLVDWAVGRVTDALAESGLVQNTLLIVTSDNGPLRGSLEPGAPERTATVSNGHQSAGTLRGFKGGLYEGGHRVPFIAKWPAGLPRGAKYSQPVISLDLYATLAALVGSDATARDSVNLLPYLRGETDHAPHDFLYWRAKPNIAVRKGKWKLWKVNKSDLDASAITDRAARRLPMKAWPQDSPVGQVTLLYDFSSDIGERTNVADKHPAVVAELEAALEAWNAQMGEPSWPAFRSTLDEVDGQMIHLFF